MASIEDIWTAEGFKPNEFQREAILHGDGPMYLTAGPGSGKTRVLLWRVINLIAFRDVKPDEILLTTFTEKAAHQLKAGLEAYFGNVSSITGRNYDLANMYIGTLHSICNRLLTDRRLLPSDEPEKSFRLMDEVEQFFFVKKKRIWAELVAASGLSETEIDHFLTWGKKDNHLNSHKRIEGCIKLFNRFSEERINPEAYSSRNFGIEYLPNILRMYARYRELLIESKPQRCDFATLQEEAIRLIERSPNAQKAFKHIIVDEYQDTNFIQEQFYFELAKANGNICVVGDDDQALYRFRGATVENFVQFPERVKYYLGGKATKTIPLTKNYRSLKEIVAFYNNFIKREDWKDPETPNLLHRIEKDVVAASQDERRAVVTSSSANYPEEIAVLCKQLLEKGKVQDPSQIAFLFPSLKDGIVDQLKSALGKEGISVYAPRASHFLDQPQALELFGVFACIFDPVILQDANGSDWRAFQGWLGDAKETGARLVNEDESGRFGDFVETRKSDLERSLTDYELLRGKAKSLGLKDEQEFVFMDMCRPLLDAGGLSQATRSRLGSPHLNKSARLRKQEGDPFTLNEALLLVSSVNWSITDLFWQLCCFSPFKEYFDEAAKGNEAPIFNMGRIADYIQKFSAMYKSKVWPCDWKGKSFNKWFFSQYLYGRFRMRDPEVENKQDPIPKGSVSFMTIHQSKGLEFPVVYVYPSKRAFPVGLEEHVVKQLKPAKQGEPLEMMSKYDKMRLLYVAFSRAEKLLIVPKDLGKKLPAQVKRSLEHVGAEPISSFKFEDFSGVPVVEQRPLPISYSFTQDYLKYHQCPRRYMIFRKYDVGGGVSDSISVGSLVHETIEDVHRKFIK